MFFTVYNADLSVVDDVRVKQSVSAFRSPSEGSVDCGNGWLDEVLQTCHSQIFSQRPEIIGYLLVSQANSFCNV